MQKEYENANIAIDPVIFTISDCRLKILLHQREKEPFKGKKELPGGLLLSNETAEDALRRKLKELLGIEDIFIKQFYTFTEPKRDPRGRVISIGFVALVNFESLGKEIQWYDIGSMKGLAFDHELIIQKARDYLKDNADSAIVRHFMPKFFALNKLQEVHEIIEEKKYDNRNFRKQMLNSGIIKETKQIEQKVSHRPARLFQFIDN